MKFSHGSHTLEVVWTILPAVTLLFIAIYQMNAWADAKMRRPNMPITAEITGRQFNWDLRYPGADGELYTKDDIVRYDGQIYLPSNEEMLLMIKSADVLHSFFLPNLRMKQDVVPGMEQNMWFKAKDRRRVRHCVRRAVRLGTLQDEGPGLRSSRVRSTTSGSSECTTTRKRRRSQLAEEE